MRYIGIYAVQCNVNGRRYIGQTRNFIKRVYNHKQELKNGTHYSKEMQADYNAYGESEFRFYMVEECSVDKLSSKEQCYMEKESNPYNSHRNYYTTTPEQCEKISKCNMGKNNPMYGKRGELSPHYGKVRSEKTKAKIARANLGKKLGLTQKEFLSRLCKERMTGSGNPMYGKHHTEETKRLMSLHKKGKKCGENAPNCKLTNLQAIDVYERAMSGEPYKTIAEDYNIDTRTVSSIKCKKAWVKVIDEYLKEKTA